MGSDHAVKHENTAKDGTEVTNIFELHIQSIQHAINNEKEMEMKDEEMKK